MAECLHINEVTLVGEAAAAPVYSHANHEERFYKFPLRVLRLSGQADELIVVAGEKLLLRCAVSPGARLCVTGQVRSYNNRSGTGSRLVITVYAQTLGEGGARNRNEVRLSGVLCKTPVCRSTPLGRTICDLMLAVNRRYGRADYLPCIAWGALAGETAVLNVGDSLSFSGRVQSRIYQKSTAEGLERRVAYEVSVMTLLGTER